MKHRFFGLVFGLQQYGGTRLNFTLYMSTKNKGILRESTDSYDLDNILAVTKKSLMHLPR